MLYKNFDAHAFDSINLTSQSWMWIGVAIAMLFVRDFAYMVRIRTLTNKELSWWQAFDVIMLWEFASAVVPPALGGGFAFAIYIIHKEKIALGKSVSIVLFSSFLDGLFLMSMGLVGYYFAGEEKLFASISINLPGFLKNMFSASSIETAFWVLYLLMVFYKLLVAFALFVNANAIKQLFLTVYSLPILRHWKKSAEITGEEMVIASHELKGKTFNYWINALIPTFVCWTARFIIVNCIIAAFSPDTFQHFILFSKQVIIGILNIGSPTPGGSGTSEVMFSQFFRDELSGNLGLAAALAVLWRLLSYYPYLFVGAVVLPRWIKKRF